MARRRSDRTFEMVSADRMDAYSEAAAADSVEEAARILRAANRTVDAETYNRAADAGSVSGAARIMQDANRGRSRSGGATPRRRSTRTPSSTSAEVAALLTDGDRMATTAVGAAAGLALVWGATNL